MTTPPDGKHQLAAFIEAVMKTPVDPSDSENRANMVEHAAQYHLEFYQQIADLAWAVLNDGSPPEHIARYGALLLHMVSCRACHSAYLELYDALRGAFSQPIPPIEHHLGDRRPLRALPPVMLEHFCLALISQAEAVLRLQENREGNSQLARHLLQIAIRVGGGIDQASVKHRALANLVNVALLTESQPGHTPPVFFSYALAMPPTTVRSGHAPAEEEVGTKRSVILVQCGDLLGEITQQERTLSLHLRELNERMRGHMLLVSFPLGTLFEPVQWYHDPRAILTPSAADERGDVDIHILLGETSLRIGDPAEKSLLEVLFLLVEVRFADMEDADSQLLLSPPSHPS